MAGASIRRTNSESGTMNSTPKVVRARPLTCSLISLLSGVSWALVKRQMRCAPCGCDYALRRVGIDRWRAANGAGQACGGGMAQGHHIQRAQPQAPHR